MLPSLLACASKYISVNQIDSIDQVTINKIAIVPFGVDRISSGEYMTLREKARQY